MSVFRRGLTLGQAALSLLCAMDAYGAGALREYDAWVTDLDIPGAVITVVHRATRYEAGLRVGEHTTLLRDREVPLEELPIGKTMRFWGSVSEDQSSIAVAGVRRSDADDTRSPLIDPPRNHVCGRLLRDGEGLCIDVAGKRVAMRTDPRNFEAIFEESAALEDFAEGRACCVTYEDTETGALARRLQVRIALPAKEALPSPASGVTADEVRETFAQATALCRAHETELACLAPVTMTVTPELARVGEEVTLRMEVLSEAAPRSDVELLPRHLATEMKDRDVVRLDWHAEGEHHGLKRYVAEAPLPAKAAGNYLLHWRCDAGGDCPEYWRNYGVVDDDSAVCLFLSTSHAAGNPGPAPDFHRVHVPFEEWAGAPLALGSVLQGNVAQWAAWSREFRQYGTRQNPHLFWPYWLKSWHEQANFQAEPPEVQRAVLEGYRELLPLLGFGDVDIVTSYTMGSAFVKAARGLGYRTISSVCSGQNFMDGPMRINHFGAPERPYFMSREDFRKAGKGGPDGLVGMAQCQRNPFLTREFNCTYCLEPAWNGFYNNGGGREEVDDIWMSRQYDFFDAMLQNRLSQRGPYFFNVGIEFNGVYPGAAEGNRMLIEYAAEKARTVPLVFSTGPAVSAYFRRHYERTPESTCYLHDYFGGQTALDKFPGYPDIMEIEGDAFKSLLRAPDLLPIYHYDYERPWSYPDWGNEGLARNSHGYLYPGLHDPFEVVPRILDTRQFEVHRDDANQPDRFVSRLTVQASVAQRNLVLALWNLPRAWQPGEDWYSVEGAARFVPIRAPFAANLNGLLVVDVSPGENTFTLTVETPERVPRRTTVHIGDTIEGRVFERDGVKMAYLWPTRPWGVTLRVALPEGACATVYVAPEGTQQQCVSGVNTFAIPSQQWMRLTGLDADAVEACCTAAP